ncbi:sigma-54-dependent transcriptional regulator [Vibrio cholerae]|uniref:sigma-54-dependent transcriptional regulator n=1 Tax=Vibrio cholerae TaxID=666 RepID=UPI0011D64D55|nr:sigma-54 dependent transcriptional regulator [Vibrio cholerae]TXY75750.1 sigma-54-dependent Fis family transcriptional regulator [Vibrio cholerae]BCI77474.1 C4-dicarboxylate transport transcriptional regulatory protein DctD [Vibrio cholerae]
MESQRIALIEDDDIVRQATGQWLQLAGFDVAMFADGASALEAIEQQSFAAIVSDVRLPDTDGLSLLVALKNVQPLTPVILITGHGDVDMAVKALHQGAFDFIEKPFQPERLANTVAQAVSQYQNALSSQSRAHYLASAKGLEQILIGQCKSIQLLREQIAKVAAMDTNVIIYGETGCGKELVAQCLHQASERQRGQFVAINCGAIPENLFESELFGHEAGAFTGAVKRRIGKLELADKGTLFLDEIESMPLAMQVKVLRVLQDHVVERVGSNQPITIDLRVIAAAKEELRQHAEFRQDLFYRLNVAQLYLPPLRYALDDSISVGEILVSRPGMTEEEASAGLPLAIQVHNFERKVIAQALHRHQGNISEVMKELDLPRRTLNQKMQKFGLLRGDFTAQEE